MLGGTPNYFHPEEKDGKVINIDVSHTVTKDDVLV